MNWVAYAYYKDKKLILGAYGHIGQSELNMQKYVLIENLKKIERYSKIESVSIFREEKSSQNNLKQLSLPSSNEKRSYGIFDNHLQDEPLYEIVERIKQILRKGIP
jgi:hypothetical protein